jgi:nitrogen fixation-related uncharacterized protein
LNPSANQANYSRSRRQLLNLFRTISNLAVFAVLVVAVELSIQFNHLETGSSSVNDVNSLAQLIPIAVSAGFVLRAVALFFVAAESGDGDDSSDEGDEEEIRRREHHHRRKRSRSSGYVTEKRTYRRSVVVDEEMRGGAGPAAPPPSHPRRSR